MERLWLSTLLIAASPYTILPLLPPVTAVAAFTAALWVHCLVLADAVDPVLLDVGVLALFGGWGLVALAPCAEAYAGRLRVLAVKLGF